MADFTYAAPPATVGETYNWTINLVDQVTGLPPNLTGYSGDFQVRQQVGSTIVLEASTSNGAMSLNANNVLGAVNILFTSSAITTAGQYQYELKLVDSTNNISKPIGGLFSVAPTITP